MPLRLPSRRIFSPALITKSSLQSQIYNYSPLSQSSRKRIDRMSTGVPSGVPSSASFPTMTDLAIESTDIPTKAGVELDQKQKVIVGSVLDLFAGKPSLKKLQLWSDTASFQDPITNAHGRAAYEPQWYGLPAVFSQITRLHHLVTSNTNPITMELKTNYKLKGIGKETVIDSIIEIYVAQDGEADQGKIVKVVDKWNGKLPEGAFATAFRNLNAATVPHLISVPKNEEEDAKKGL